MAKYSGKGWHFQSQRHSNAARTGRAGGTYAGWRTMTSAQRHNAKLDRIMENWREGLKEKNILSQKKYNKSYDELSNDEKRKIDYKHAGKKNFGYASSGFKTFPLKDGYEIEAHFEKTRNGFRHIAVLKDKYGHIVDEAKATYLNRTWESYEYQTVINKLLDKSGVLTEPEKKSFLQKGELQAKKESEAMFGNVAMIAQMGEIFGNTQKEKNDWKARMLKAGLPALDIPEDWEKLSEDEKESRLNKVIEQMKPSKKNDEEIKEIEKLSPHYDNRKDFYGKAKVEIEGSDKKLFSYGTKVAEIKNGVPIVNDTYSATTLRHIKEFLKQNGFRAENKEQIIKDYKGE